MLEDLSSHAFLTLSDVAHLRLEALQMFEQGLASHDVSDLMRFIERQIAQDPPQMTLLRELAADLEERLALLHTYRLDVREQVVRLLAEGYAADITPLAPIEAIEQYHTLRAADIMSQVRAAGGEAIVDEPLLSRVVETSLRKATELHRKIELAQQVFRLLADWLDGISATTARRYGHYFVDRKQHTDLWH